MIDHLFTQLPNSTYTIRIDPDASVAPVQETVARVFDKQPVAVTGGSVEGGEIEVIRDGQRIAVSSADELLQAVLLVNSDVYISGSRPLEDCRLPDVLCALEEIPFLVRGYPESDTEKLLLIAVSREIERRAYNAGRGTLHVGFQQLSRLVGEPGTYRVYEQLSETDLDIHAYGVEDTTLPAALDLTVHSGSSQFYRRSWFVVFQPPSDEQAAAQPPTRAAGLFSTEREPNRWGGFWTFDPDRVDSIVRTITEVTSGDTADTDGHREL